MARVIQRFKAKEYFYDCQSHSACGFFGTMIAIGIYCRKHSTDVQGFVLGSRNVGPWLTAFAYGTSYFSAVVFVGYAGQFGWKYGVASTWIGLERH